MNRNKTRGTQPDYSGAIKFVDGEGKTHKIYASAWVNGTRSGSSLITLRVKPYEDYVAKCVELIEGSAAQKKAERQALRTKRLEYKAIPKKKPVKEMGDNVTNQYFGVRQTEGEGNGRQSDNGSEAQGSASEEIPEVHDNTASGDSGKDQS